MGVGGVNEKGTRVGVDDGTGVAPRQASVGVGGQDVVDGDGDLVAEQTAPEELARLEHERHLVERTRWPAHTTRRVVAGARHRSVRFRFHTCRK